MASSGGALKFSNQSTYVCVCVFFKVVIILVNELSIKRLPPTHDGRWRECPLTQGLGSMLKGNFTNMHKRNMYGVTTYDSKNQKKIYTFDHFNAPQLKYMYIHHFNAPQSYKLSVDEISSITNLPYIQTHTRVMVSFRKNS